ncbi:MAG: metal-dependent hydrolase [Deltaproteobacteria bacterium]
MKFNKKITPRRMDFEFDENAIPRWWFADNPLMTHYANGLNLVFPEGERFFIRSVAHYLDQLDDEELKSRARAFFAQEASHGREHTHSFEMLERQGFKLSKYLRFYEKRAVPTLEKLFPPAFRLATTAALEHLTATLGERALADDVLDLAHPAMRDLLRWHAAEEIEHKSVAYDVFQTVDGRYWVRIFGMTFGLATLMLFWTIGARMLLAQEKLTRKEKRYFAKRIPKNRRNETRKLFRRAFIDYLRRDFHPDDRDDYHLAAEYLAGIGRLAA